MATTWLTAAEAAAHADRARQFVTAGAASIKPATIRQWARRGHLQPAGLSENNHALYRLADVARAEATTRARALRLVGIGMHQAEAFTIPPHA
ncbi:MerR family transcriptional regulator [Streptomyces sp. NPDC087532]|uniref:MerR family transcriptional regulator n=1 Tax=unclassified Streptomyces TaxID=2593676 RepID=UPI0034262A76